MAANVEAGAGYLVKRVQQSLRRNCDAALRPTGLSMAQYTVLRALADHPQASAAELARLCFVTRQSLQDVLSGLRADALVEESAGPQRGRARSLQLTA
ncbi:MarR family transcriptional regulator, partial [Mycobacterium sp. 20091114027_K0903767]|nr:MarR family transcriptional regulator [Mycobacterium sp. 20091114027_K0903767]